MERRGRRTAYRWCSRHRRRCGWAVDVGLPREIIPTTPECAPARVSLLTGRFCSAHGVRANPTVNSPELRLGTTDMVT